MRLLEVFGADLRARDVACDREHRRAGAVGVVQPVDQVQVTRAAAAGADGQLAGELRLGSGRECRGLLVPDVDPVDAAVLGAAGAPNGVDDRVEAVTDDPVDAVDPRVDELGDELICDCRGHAPHSTPGPIRPPERGSTSRRPAAYPCSHERSRHRSGRITSTSSSRRRTATTSRRPAHFDADDVPVDEEEDELVPDEERPVPLDLDDAELE